MDVDDDNVLFEEWLSNMIHDPIRIYFVTTQVRYLLSDPMVETMAEHKFLSRAKTECDALSDAQLIWLYDLMQSAVDKSNIFDQVCIEMKEKREQKLSECIAFIAHKKENKLSFLNVTALNNEKLIDFIKTDLNIQDDINRIVENIRLCLKIHTNSLDDKFDDDLEDANILFSHQHAIKSPRPTKSENDEKMSFDDHLHRLINDKRAKYKNFQFDGKYLSEWIRAHKQRIAAEKAEQQSNLELAQTQIETKATWKHKGSLSDLTTFEVAEFIKERIESIPSYKKKINEIEQKILDKNMSGNAFVSNLKRDKNVFVHRLVEVFGDEKYRKFVEKIYADLMDENVLKEIACEDIEKYKPFQLAEYLKMYQIKEMQLMVLDMNIDGDALNKYKRHQFAKLLKENCDFGIGVGTMLYKKIKEFEFIRGGKNEKRDEDQKEELEDCPPIEFVSLVKISLQIENDLLCNKLWEDMLKKCDDGELEKMSEQQMIRYFVENLNQK